MKKKTDKTMRELNDLSLRCSYMALEPFHGVAHQISEPVIGTKTNSFCVVALAIRIESRVMRKQYSLIFLLFFVDII